MRTAFFSAKPYDRSSFNAQNNGQHDITYLEPHLTPATASLAHGYPCVCVFVNDTVNATVLDTLHAGGTRLIALRSAGYNHVDLTRAKQLGITVVRVPAYSPYAVAEHTAALMLALNRHIPRAFNRVREGDFSIHGLLGFDLHGKTVGVVGTGKIGEAFCNIARGFGCQVIAHDLQPNPACEAIGVQYVKLSDLLQKSDIISLHCPLTPQTRHLIDDGVIAKVKPGVMLLNTSRGALIDTRSMITALKSGKVGYLGIDVYEEEADLFFEDLSDYILQDDVFARLLTFPNVIVTGHQAFFTREAVDGIATTTLHNITAFETDSGEIHTVSA
jgi:D-lactate dehydrogenase